MKKLLFAVIVLALSACTKEISITVEPRQPIHVTVGAGIGDANPQTRSQVEKDGTTRTLKFTDGDRLYIVGNIDDTHRMGGYLDLTSGEGTTSATFAGDLTVWVTSDDFQYSADNTYMLQHPDNPMLEYGENLVEATLIHQDAIPDAISIDKWTQLCSFHFYKKNLVTGESDNASKLMETALIVQGLYDATTDGFSLFCVDPIINCNFTIDGLTPGTAYYVCVEKDNKNTTYDQTVTADANGYVNFACTTGLYGRGNWTIKLCTNKVFSTFAGASIYERPIGNKTLGAKVYNVGNYTAPDPDPDPGISLSNVTSAHIGWIGGNDGKAYSSKTALPSGVSAVAMICMLDNAHNGLAIELNVGSNNITWDLAKSYAKSKFPVAGFKWRLPSNDEWTSIVAGCGGAAGFISKFKAAGVNINEEKQYWTSSEFDSNHAYYTQFNGTDFTFDTDVVSEGKSCLSILAFSYETTYDPTKDITPLNAVTSAFIGNIVGSDGNVYPHDATMPDGVSKAAMICCVSSTGHGLAIELNGIPQECLFGGGSNPAAITGGTWRTPTREDWQNMVNSFKADNAIKFVDNFVDSYNATGVSFAITNYWTSDTDGGVPPQNGYYLKFYEMFKIFIKISKAPLSIYIPDLYNKNKVYHLACLEF